MKDAQLIEDYGFLKMYIRHDVYAEDSDLIKAGSEFITISLEGPAKSFYRQYTFPSTLEQFFGNVDRVKDEAHAVLFGSARQLLTELQNCLSETNDPDSKYRYVPKQTFIFQAMNNLNNQ